MKRAVCSLLIVGIITNTTLSADLFLRKRTDSDVLTVAPKQVPKTNGRWVPVNVNPPKTYRQWGPVEETVDREIVRAMPLVAPVVGAAVRKYGPRAAIWTAKQIATFLAQKGLEAGWDAFLDWWNKDDKNIVIQSHVLLKYGETLTIHGDASKPTEIRFKWLVRRDGMAARVAVYAPYPVEGPRTVETIDGPLRIEDGDKVLFTGPIVVDAITGPGAVIEERWVPDGPFQWHQDEYGRWYQARRQRKEIRKRRRQVLPILVENNNRVRQLYRDDIVDGGIYSERVP